MKLWLPLADQASLPHKEIHSFSRNGKRMDGKARFIFPITMAFFMALMMTAVVTFINLGFPSNYVGQWMKAFAVAWPLASCVAFLAVPLARRITAQIIRVIGP
jgi:hypothetical protein